MSKIVDNRNLIISGIIFLLFLISLVIYTSLYQEYASGVSINFYIVSAQIIPVFLIALSVYSLKRSYTKKAYMADLFAVVLPILVGEIACLAAIATNQSTALALSAVIYAIIALLTNFCVMGYYLENSYNN